jgi:hypothetical protein
MQDYMPAQFGNNWIQKNTLTAQSSEFCSSNYFQIGQHVYSPFLMIKQIGMGSLDMCHVQQIKIKIKKDIESWKSCFNS